MGSEALARVGPEELNEGMHPSDLDLLVPAPPPEEALPLPPPPAPPLPPPPPPLPGKQDPYLVKGKRCSLIVGPDQRPSQQHLHREKLGMWLEGCKVRWERLREG